MWVSIDEKYPPNSEHKIITWKTDNGTGTTTGLILNNYLRKRSQINNLAKCHRRSPYLMTHWRERNMKDIQFKVEDLLVDLQDFRAKLVAATRNCTNCLSFSASTYHCDIFNAQVPANVIVKGCDSYNNAVPF